MTEGPKSPPNGDDVLKEGTPVGATALIEGPWGYANWRAFTQGSPEVHAEEYALISDAHFTGHLISGQSPYQVLNMIAPHDGMARHALTLRVGMHLEDDTVGAKLAAMSATKKPESDLSHFHGGDLRDEIAALLSLALAVRIQAAEHTRDFRPGGDPRGTPVAFENRPIRPLIRSGARYVAPGVVGSRLLETDLVAIYPTLDAADATTLLRAARSYQEALWVAEGDANLAWLLLISAIETAANQWYPIEGKGSSLAPAELLGMFRPTLVTQLHDAGGPALVEATANELAHLFKATDKFIRFLERFMPDPPAPRPPDWLALAWSKGKLRDALSKVYELRSNALHGDIPFPPPMSEAPFPADPDETDTRPIAEVPYYTLSYQKGGFWSSADTPMLLNTFEYITRYALQGWWRWLGAQAAGKAKAVSLDHGTAE